jgi:hypothetical protein
MLKNPCNSTVFYLNTHDKHPPQSPLIKGGLRGVLYLSVNGWPATLRTVRSLRSSLFHHVCLPYVNKITITGG